MVFAHSDVFREKISLGKDFGDEKAVLFGFQSFVHQNNSNKFEEFKS
jgi:hypothetical protein